MTRPDGKGSNLNLGLRLQDNELSSLTNGSGGASLDSLSDLQVLDVHNNSLEKLPEDIGSLKSLKVSS